MLCALRAKLYCNGTYSTLQAYHKPIAYVFLNPSSKAYLPCLSAGGSPIITNALGQLIIIYKLPVLSGYVLL